MIQIEWGNAEKTIILWKFEFPWTWTEYHIAQQETCAMIDTVPWLVDLIFLASKEQGVPKDAIIHLRTIVQRRHDRSNQIVVVAAQPRLSILINMLLGLIPNARVKLWFAKTLSDAYELLAARSEALLEERTG